MLESFYLAGAIAVAATALAISRANIVHALLYLVVSLISLAVIFFILGAPLAAALEIIIYAGAIVVLFLFVVMMLHAGDTGMASERAWLTPRVWRGPISLALLQFAGFVYFLGWSENGTSSASVIGPKQVGLMLYQRYAAAVLLVALLLLAGLVGAFHLGQRRTKG